MAPRKQTAEPKPLTGFAVGKHSGRTKTYVCDLPDFEGFEIKAKRLTFAELRDLPDLEATHDEVWQHIHPYVVGWNAQAETEAGDWEDVPPPAEAGPEVFMLIEPELSVWIYAQLKFGYLGGAALRKKPTTPESTSGTDDASS